MKSPSLGALYQTTLDLFAGNAKVTAGNSKAGAENPKTSPHKIAGFTDDSVFAENSTAFRIGHGRAFAALDWIDRIPPLFTAACRAAVAAESMDDFALWRSWIGGAGLEQVRNAAAAEEFSWLKSWLTLLVDLGATLAKDGAFREETCGRDAAAALARNAPPPFDILPPAFWRDLARELSGKPAAPPGGSHALAFPLVLSERMVIGGETVGVIVVEFLFERTGSGPVSLYPDPREMAIRRHAPSFLEAYRHAAEAVSMHLPPGSMGSVRVGLRARRPEHERLLRRLALSGPSGGGALAVGGHALLSRAAWPAADLAVSAALTERGADAPDGLLHAVGGAYEKVQGCAKQGIRRLLVSTDQAGETGFYGGLQEVAIAEAETLRDAFHASAAGPEAPGEAESETPAREGDESGLLSFGAGSGGSARIASDRDENGHLAPEDGGVMPLDSSLYVPRDSDEALESALRRRPMIVLVKGPRQIGKTSLLVRGADQARRAGVRFVYIDLQSLGRETIGGQRDLFFALARIFAQDLELGVSMDDIYDERDGPNKNFENYLLQYVLDSPVVWFMDEVDRLFDFDFSTDVFSLMRSWHNRRPVRKALANLTLVLAYATETHLLIEDPYQSPFNVGVTVELRDFTAAQAARMNERLGRPLRDDAEIRAFHDLTGGHPYLTCRGLTWMARERVHVGVFAAKASLDNGPFGAHLRRLRPIAGNSEHAAMVRGLLRGESRGGGDAFLHLRSAGVLTGDDPRNARIRCPIYAEYLRGHLTPDETGQSRPHARAASAIWRALRKSGA